MTRLQLARWANVFLGAWLAFSPALLRYPYLARDAARHGLFVGLLVALVAFAAMLVPRVRLANTFLGLWLIAAPFALGYEWSPSIANSVAVGVLVVVGSLTPSRRDEVPLRRMV